MLCANVCCLTGDCQALCNMVAEAWNVHKDTLCVGINWELFRDQDHVLASIAVFIGFSVVN